jgi:uncharacterized lipoprotein (TIGR02269 family)
VSSWKEACEDARSLVFLCGEKACAFYRCQDVTPGRVVRTRGSTPIARPPLSAPGSTAQRYWGSAQGLPGHAQPVFVIPWYNDKPQRALPLFTEEQLQELERASGKPVEKHHIFPQEAKLKEWFELKGINVHEWTLVLLKEDHDRIHRGARGGPWNEAWRQYRDNNRGASKEAIWLHAGELIHRFGLYGPVFPYYRQKTAARTAAQQ